MLNIVKIIRPLLVKKIKYPIISNLFKKRNQQMYEKHIPPQPQPQKNQNNQEPEDGQYDFFERRKEIDTSFDFTKIQGSGGQNIPQKLGQGGIQEVLYWSQSAVTSPQITDIVVAFNKTHKNTPQIYAILNQHQVHLDEFNNRVLGNVYLVNSLKILQQYAVYAYKFNIDLPQFWEKIEYKTTKFFPEQKEELGWLIDIGFLMGQFKYGQYIYNHVCKMLQDKDMSIDQYVKLYLTFNMLKIGEKVWIDKLLNGIADNMVEADAEQMTGVLGALKDAKKLPENMHSNIQSRTFQLIDMLNTEQIMSIIDFFGFDHKNDEFWKMLEQKLDYLLQNKQITPQLMSLLIHQVMNTYQLSTSFILKYIVEPLKASKLSMIGEFEVTTISALSKGLYIYELEAETKNIELELSKLTISKMTKDISDLSDKEVVKVIQDYNLTRNGSRELYIFFEEVVRIRYLRGYNQQTDRHTVQLLIEIYKNSGMCSREMYDGLNDLILDD